MFKCTKWRMFINQYLVFFVYFSYTVWYTTAGTRSSSKTKLSNFNINFRKLFGSVVETFHKYLHFSSAVINDDASRHVKFKLLFKLGQHYVKILQGRHELTKVSVVALVFLSYENKDIYMIFDMNKFLYSPSWICI